MSTIYLRADESLQINPICLMLMDEETAKGSVGLLIRVPILSKKNDYFLTSSVAHIPIHFIPKNKAIKKELHFIPEKQIDPKSATKFIHFVTKNPQVLAVLEEKIFSLTQKKEIPKSIYALFNGYKATLSYEHVSSFTMSTLHDGIFIVEQHGEFMHNVGAFKLTERGGYFHFTTYVAAIYDNVAQTIPINCKMYLFLDDEQLGYYFEFYLNQQSMLHQKIYDLLPDMLMSDETFLAKTLAVLESCTFDQPSIVELIEKLRESI